MGLPPTPPLKEGTQKKITPQSTYDPTFLFLNQIIYVKSNSLQKTRLKVVSFGRMACIFVWQQYFLSQWINFFKYS